MTHHLALVAHRGASALAPENTLAAFARALALGVHAIETDVRTSRDGALVLSHDATLQRRAGRPEPVAALDAATLRGIVVGTDAEHGAQTIPALGDLLALVAGRARVLLDLKLPTGHESTLHAAIRAAAAEDWIILGVRTPDALRAWQTTAPHLATLAFGRTPADTWALAEAGATIARLWSPWLNDAALARAAQLAKPVWVMCGNPGDGTVGETTVEELAALRRAGVAAALLNDPRPGLAANAAALSAGGES